VRNRPILRSTSTGSSIRRIINRLWNLLASRLIERPDEEEADANGLRIRPQPTKPRTTAGITAGMERSAGDGTHQPLIFHPLTLRALSIQYQHQSFARNEPARQGGHAVTAAALVLDNH